MIGTFSYTVSGAARRAAGALWFGLSRLLAPVLVVAIRLYQLLVSPAIGFLAGPGCGCRFSPSCSQYAVDAIRRHGAFEGAWLAIKRICRCHPFGGCGPDPAPEKSTNANAPRPL